MLTHHNLTAAMLLLINNDIVSDPEKAVILTLLPLYHIYALVVMMGACLHLGSTLVLLSRFEPNSFLKTLQNYKVWLLLLLFCFGPSIRSLFGFTIYYFGVSLFII